MSKTNETKMKKGWIVALVLAAVLILALLLLPKSGESAGNTDSTEETSAVQASQPEETAPDQPQRLLKDTLRIDKIDSYTGLYVEDGSDEAVSGLLMMLVTNISEEPVQYAEIALDLGDETAKFSVSVLPAGGTAVLIEQNRMAYDKSVDYASASAECVHLADFEKPISLREDILQIQVLEGAINIMNISGEDIDGTILLCYKNISNGVYHGGIAYRVRLEGGLKAGEVKQIMGTHFRQDGSEILFVDIAA